MAKSFTGFSSPSLAVFTSIRPDENNHRGRGRRPESYTYVHTLIYIMCARGEETPPLSDVRPRTWYVHKTPNHTRGDSPEVAAAARSWAKGFRCASFRPREFYILFPLSRVIWTAAAAVTTTECAHDLLLLLLLCVCSLYVWCRYKADRSRFYIIIIINCTIMLYVYISYYMQIQIQSGALHKYCRRPDIATAVRKRIKILLIIIMYYLHTHTE